MLRRTPISFMGRLIMNGLKLPVLGLELGSTRIKAVLVDGAGA